MNPSIPDALYGIPAGLVIILIVDQIKVIYDPGRYAGLLAFGIAFAIGVAYLAVNTTQPLALDAGEALMWGLSLPVVKSALLAPLADATNPPGQSTVKVAVVPLHDASSSDPPPHG